MHLEIDRFSPHGELRVPAQNPRTIAFRVWMQLHLSNKSKFSVLTHMQLCEPVRDSHQYVKQLSEKHVQPYMQIEEISLYSLIWDFSAF